jgi:hypothetical protein
MIGGTGRRWSTAEPCHPLLAILRAGVANPVILIDEVEKAATRTDYGRLWDSLLPLLEVETASRYPDPALQTTLNLAHVSYLATANAVEPLPQPLRDRFRILAFPTPTSEDIHALLPPLAEGYADERGQDVRWFAPFSGEEIEAVAASWKRGLRASPSAPRRRRPPGPRQIHSATLSDALRTVGGSVVRGAIKRSTPCGNSARSA